MCLGNIACSIVGMIMNTWTSGYVLARHYMISSTVTRVSQSNNMLDDPNVHRANFGCSS